MSEWESISDIASDVQAGKMKASDLVDKSLKLIREKKEYKAIIATCEDRAKKRALEIDKQIANGEIVGRLAGVPFIVKDNFLTYGSETTAASNILKGFQAPYQATAIELLEREGAICVAKANLDAFAHGSSTENSDFFTTLNAHNKQRVPGGSSGGSATSVVIGLVPFALGTDTGGSIRQPASFSGCVGYKPTYGLVSRSGVIAMGSSCDVIGPLANSVSDTATILDVIAGKDALDSTTIDPNPDGYKLGDRKVDIKGKKIGVIKENIGRGVEKDVKEQINVLINKLKQAGAKVSEVSLPSLDLALAVYYVIVPAEISSNLSRYDGQKYGYNAKDAKSLDESYKKTRSKGFGAEAKRRIMTGTYVLSSGYYDAYYKKAQTVRTKLINEFNEAFSKYDYLIGPTTPSTAFKIGEKSKNPLQMYLSDTMTVAANLTGIPAISLPTGLVNNLPIGLQIMAPQRKDYELLQISKEVEAIV